MINLYKNYCTRKQHAGIYRILPEDIVCKEERYIDFSHNDYLGFSQSKELKQAVRIAVKLYGVGATGSRLLSGNHGLFETIEQQIAQDKNTQAALIFNSGFQANIAVLSSLLDSSTLGATPLVFFDKLNHSSLYQAIFLSGAQLIRYRHNDMEHLSSLLSKFQHSQRPKFMVSETVFGMDGDCLPIKEFLCLASKHHAFVYLDEAHATGIFGSHGYGLSTNYSFEGIPHVIMGTFSKALGCFGAYVACCNITKEYLINKSSGFIYSTALPPMLVAALTCAWRRVRLVAKQRKALMDKAKILRTSLCNSGFNIGKSETHIVPIILGKEHRVIQAKQKLLEHNIIVSSIRPPTVPPGLSRLRVALCINHSEEDIQQLIKHVCAL